MKMFNKLFLYIAFIIAVVSLFNGNVFASRAANQIEVYQIGDTSATIKWTPYVPSSGTVQNYTVGYEVSGDTTYAAITVDGTAASPDYNAANNEYSKKITGLNVGTIYNVKIDTYLQGNPTPVAFYNSIQVMTKIDIDRTIPTISNPYGNDNVGHLNFAFYAPNEMVGGVLSSVNKSNITGYMLTVSSSQGQIYSSGQPYEVLYNSSTGNYDAYIISTTTSALTFNPGTGAQQFSYPPQSIGGKDALGFALYKSNEPGTDNFNMATIYYVFVQPIFKIGSPYQNVIVDATARYTSVDNIATLMPLTVTQVANNLVELTFSSVGTGSMSYDVYRGRLSNSLSKIHTEYDDGTRNTIEYFNQIDNPQNGDVYYFQVEVSGQTYGVASKIIPITISLTPNIAPTINNVQIEKVIPNSVSKSSDVIISWDKPDNEDINKPNLLYRVYLNTDQINQVYTNDVVHDSNGNIVRDSNGYIVLNTIKDINNNNILFNGLPVVYERAAQIAPASLTGSSSVYTGNDPVGNFLATGNNYYTIIRNGQQVTRTIYRIKGANFLTNADAPLVGGAHHTIYMSNTDGELMTDYKTKIQLNTNYFLKMDSYNTSVSQKSDFSIPVGFTTPTDIVSTIPVPQNFGVELVNSNQIGLVWDPLDSSKYDPTKVTYEVFVSNTDNYADTAFNRLKTIPYVPNADGKKHILIDTTYSLIDALGNDLPNMPANVQPNTVYLFKVRAIWNTVDAAGNNVSVYSGLSPIVPVTTKRTPISDPNMTAPPAPVDFTVTNASSKTASFTWSKVDNSSTYRIIKTSNLIDKFAPVPAPPNDGVTTGFTLTGNTYSYSDGTLTSNTLYYFSIRSEDVVNGQTLYSAWITVPVTTALVESPTNLTLVSRSTDGHSATISWQGRGNLDYQSAKKDDSMVNYQISETVTGDPTIPGLKTFQLTLQGLNSNDVYLIKVRSKDSAIGMFSKYTDPIEVRTQFNQTDYDTNVENQAKAKIIDDQSQKWIKDPVSRIGYETGKFELWAKYAKASSVAKNSSYSVFTVNLNDNDQSQYKNVYLPIDLLDTLNNTKKNLEVKTEGGSIFIRPGLLGSDKIPDVLNIANVGSQAVKIQANELSSTDASAVVPAGSFAASKVWDISITADGYNKSASDLDAAISNTVNTIVTQEKALVGFRTEDQVKTQLDMQIRSQVKALLLSSLLFETPVNIGGGKIRMIFSYNSDDSGKSNGYAAYVKNGSTSQEIQGQINEPGKIDFETPALGKIVILGKSTPEDIGNSQMGQDIKDIISKYNFSKEVVNGKFRPDDAATRTDVISFIIDVLQPSGLGFDGLNDVDKAKKLGLLDGFPTWDLKNTISREELAYLLSKVYQIKTGINPDNFVPSKNIDITDGDSIDSQYRNSILELIDENVMSTISGYFYPLRQVTRADAVQAIEKMMGN